MKKDLFETKNYVAAKGTKIRIEKSGGKVINTSSKQLLKFSAYIENNELCFGSTYGDLIYVSIADAELDTSPRLESQISDEDLARYWGVDTSAKQGLPTGYRLLSHQANDEQAYAQMAVRKNFDNVPVEGDTTIRFQREMKWEEFDVLYQRWSWDGIAAESIIFLSHDVSHLSDVELEKEVRTSPIISADSSVTIKRTKDGYTFFNFNFEY
jgi:hypothetical protein